MSESDSPDYKALFLREKRRNQHTTLSEFIRACHTLLSTSLKVETPSRSTRGTIPPPSGKYCPTRLRLWEDCPARQQAIYNAVRSYLEPAGQDAPRLFSSIVALEDIGRRFGRRPLSSEQDLESYERFAVEDHVHDVIAELCKIPEARQRFRLGNGVRFDNHANALDEVEVDPSEDQPANPHRSRPDQFCIHRIDDNNSTLLTTVEYKPPHKLSVENLRVGLRPMEFWETVVKPDIIPSDEAAKLKHNAERLVGAALTQEYHVMIQEGLGISYLTNGLAQVLLHIPYDDPSTLCYYLCEPNMDVNAEDDQSFQQPSTAIARVLCLCLMSFSLPVRDQEWRNRARAGLHIWKTSFDHTRAQIPEDELQRTPPNSGYTGSQGTSSDYASSDYLPSSPLDSHSGTGRRISTRSRPGCSPSDTVSRNQREDSPDPDSHQGAPARKRGISQVASSPPTQRSTRQSTNDTYNGQHQHRMVPFCTQRCLLGLQRNAPLDANCPNVALHRQGQNGNRHLVTAGNLVGLLKRQLDEDLDHNCTPLGNCGAYGAPFKITCAIYGYTIVGKGTTSRLWKEVSREADIYHVLRKAQGSAVPVFLGAIDLAKIYFLHGAGEIRHMLFMAWGGESTSRLKLAPALWREISRSKNEIRALGVVHQDLRPDNILWNSELGRALIIDFHRSTLDRRPAGKRVTGIKRSLFSSEARDSKRLRVK
ncbi:hypothetical protein CNMCM8980_001147 [Aspergillus fumigatiaffinis]|nr:hypothetical protein CNMCM8980_001147 [Aspergillus fumigatiaffinis]